MNPCGSKKRNPECSCNCLYRFESISQNIGLASTPSESDFTYCSGSQRFFNRKTRDESASHISKLVLGVSHRRIVFFYDQA